MKPWRRRDWVLMAVSIVVAFGAVVLAFVADESGTRFVAILVTISATINVGLAVSRLRHHRQQQG